MKRQVLFVLGVIVAYKVEQFLHYSNSSFTLLRSSMKLRPSWDDCNKAIGSL